MATLGNLLTRRGGLAMTPRLVRLNLAVPDNQGAAPLVEEVEVALLPVSEARKARAVNAARQYVEQRRDFGDAPAIGDELVLRFIVEAMRNPEDLRVAFVEAKNVDTLREVLVGEQLAFLVREYAALIRSEYPETILEDAAAIKEQAKSVFTDGQPAL